MFAAEPPLDLKIATMSDHAFEIVMRVLLSIVIGACLGMLFFLFKVLFALTMSV
jgi:hypothetical protein